MIRTEIRDVGKSERVGGGQNKISVAFFIPRGVPVDGHAPPLTV